MKINRTEYENKILDFIGVKEELDKIENNWEKNISRSNEVNEEVTIDIDISGNEVAISTQETGEIYDINWKIDITPPDPSIEMKKINFTTDEVIYKFPPGDYIIEASIEYENSEQEQERRFHKEISIP